MLDLVRTELLTTFAATSLPAALFRLMAAALLGAVIGWEREAHDKPAGLRTHILISIAACLFTLIAFDLMALDEKAAGDALRVDPIRVIEAVTAGVAFLAAGSIITQGAQVRGLTTGAGMWMAGAVGLSCGTGNVPLAALATTLTVVVMWLLRRFVRDTLQER
ncbi:MULTISPECIES: MgtC/SapB family protein [unclassified Roseivivax]|uniref:MgtC/SapB family protein n=1 Tax=Roseivivax sp. GX 12232 TaxID=2900547 RepID=UPI001E4176C5|nr:MgtC/SapB family protein [Roseivivax sp. GX 12232]MCE0505152.1 MgtC/SapB family protein [Roseivivax sp. GX 12232]